MFRKFNILLLAASFLSSLLTPLSSVQAQGLLGLPEPGTMVNVSPRYVPAMLKGLIVHKENPFVFDFIVDEGNDHLVGEGLKEESTKLIKYFLAGLTIPEKDLWVNLSPYEKNRIVPELLGQTAMGRDLLAQDYLLKQITASLIYPEKDLGRRFWDEVYARAQQMYGTTKVPVNTFNKVWITADRARVLEHNNTAFVVDCHLKVMLEQDYLARQKHGLPSSTPNGPASIGANIVREIILPQLEQEVNSGKNFTAVRQIFNSIILASWYRIRLTQALLNQVYTNKGKIRGIDLQDKTIKEKIYQRYLQAYKKGVFNFIKEDVDPLQGITVPRKYFSGGMLLAGSKAEHPDIGDIEGHQSEFDHAMSSSEMDLVRAFLKGAGVSPEAMGRHHVKTIHSVSTYTDPATKETYPLLYLKEIYRFDFSSGLRSRLPQYVQGTTALLLRKSILENAAAGQEIKLKEGMGIFPKEYDGRILHMDPRVKAILPGYHSNAEQTQWESKAAHARRFVIRIASYFSQEIRVKGFNEPLELVNFNWEYIKNENVLVPWPFGGGANLDEDDRQAYEAAGLILTPVRVSRFNGQPDQKDFQVMVENDPRHPSREMPWAKFKRVYFSRSKPNPLPEILGEGHDETRLFRRDPGKFQYWARVWAGQIRATSSPAQIAVAGPVRGQTVVALSSRTPVNGHDRTEPSALTRNPNGGIDLSAQQMHWDITRQGRGVEMDIDPALVARIKREGLESLTPVIDRITTITSIWPLVGLPSPQQ